MTRNISLKARLVGLLLACVALAWLATAALGYAESREETEELFDAHLAQSASLLIAQLGDHAYEVDTEHAPVLHRYARKVAFQIWEGGRVLRLHSLNAPSERLSASDEGFSDTWVEGERWRVVSAWGAGGKVLVQVGERADARHKIAGEIAVNLLRPVLVVLPLLALAIWLAIGRGLKPLGTLAAQVAEREAGHLAVLDVGPVPREVLPVVEELNALFGRVAASLENERRFTADAAHELRTPLAAIYAQAQAALGAVPAAADSPERRRALEKVIDGCQRATRLMEQLLVLARLDADAWRAHLGPVDLHGLSAEVLAEMAPAAVAKDIELALADEAPAVVRGDRQLLRVLLRNLVDNALRYCPAGSTVTVGLPADEGSVRLVVGDNGPGVPPDQREKILQRFYRVLGSEASGSGLGLSIVARIAELHAASLDLGLGEGGRGLAVSVGFRRA